MRLPRDIGEWLALALVAVVAASVITGLVLIGGPGAARAEKQDQARLQELAKLATALTCYRQGIGPLPDDLGAVRAAIETATSKAHFPENCQNIEWPNDPITGTEFEIKGVTADTASLCAVFARPSPGRSGYYYTNASINLDEVRPVAGRHCYTAILTKSQP